MTDIKNILEGFGDRVLSGIHQNMEDEGLGQSNLAQSLDYTVDGNRITITADGYWKYAQEGRGPGKTPYNFADILISWMRRYGIQPLYGDERSFAWAIKKTIEERGTQIGRGEKPKRDFAGDVIDTNLAWLEEQCLINMLERFEVDFTK